MSKVRARARDEEEVRETLSKIWNQPSKARIFLERLLEKNQDLYDFEKQLEEPNK